MNKTSIEWALNPDGTPGYTWNPITGCLNNCSYCYARTLANTRLKARCLANTNYAIQTPEFMKQLYVATNPFYPRFWEDRLLDPVDKAHLTKNNEWVEHRQKAKGIFVCDMSDLFGIGIPEDWTRRVLDAMSISKPTHRFYLLTKQPQNLPPFSPLPDKCYVGVSATNHLQARKGMKGLRDIKAKIKFMSFEPLLADIGFNDTRWSKANQVIRPLDWVIIGACTGNIADLQRLAAQHKGTRLVRQSPKWTLQPKIEWVKEIIEACDKAGIPVFLKNNLEPLWTIENRIEPFFKFSRSSPEATEMGYLRQEMPNA